MKSIKEIKWSKTEKIVTGKFPKITVKTVSYILITIF